MQIISPDLGIRNRPETKLLIHPTGADQSQVITDASFGGPKTITVVGNTKNVSQDLRHPYAKSAIYFPGGSSYLSTPDSQDWALGANNFVIEGWFYFLSSATSKFLVAQVYTSGAYWCLDINGAGQFRFYCINSSELINFSSSFAAAVSSLYFVALARSGNNWRFYVNGNLTNTVTNSISIPDFSPALELGTYDHSSYSFNGYISDFRLSFGTDRGYTGSAIPIPTAYLASDSYTKLLIRGDNVTQPTMFKDLSPSAKTITTAGSVQTLPLPPGGMAAYFDGSGDYLTLPDSSDFNFGVGDFTFHFWVQFASLGTNSQVLYMRRYDANNMVQIATINTNDLYLSLDGGSGNYTYYTIDANFVAGVLYHIAWCRCSGVHFIFINGNRYTATPTAAGTPNINMVAATYIGANYVGTSNLNGYMKEFTVVKGRALWTRNFTPPNRLA